MNTISTLNIYDAEQASAISGLQGQIIRRYCRNGLLPARKFGKTHYVIAAQDLVKFLADHKAGKFDGRRRENKSK